MYNPLVAPSPLAARYGGIGHGKLSVGVPDFPRLLLDGTAWYRSDRLITLNGSTVSAWGDLTGNGNTATQGTEGNQLTYVQSAINGKPALQTDGGDELQSSAVQSYGTTAVTVLGVFYLVPDSSAQTLLTQNLSTAISWFIQMTASNTIEMVIRDSGGTAGSAHSATITEGAHVITARFNGSADAADRVRLSLNGEAETLSNSKSSFQTADGVIRILRKSGDPPPSGSQVSEVSVIGGQAVSDSVFTSIDNYALSSYGL